MSAADDSRAAERADVLAYLARKLANANNLASVPLGFEDEAQAIARQISVLREDLAAGLHEGEAQMPSGESDGGADLLADLALVDAALQLREAGFLVLKEDKIENVEVSVKYYPIAEDGDRLSEAQLQGVDRGAVVSLAAKLDAAGYLKRLNEQLEGRPGRIHKLSMAFYPAAIIGGQQ